MSIWGISSDALSVVNLSILVKLLAAINYLHNWCKYDKHKTVAIFISSRYWNMEYMNPRIFLNMEYSCMHKLTNCTATTQSIYLKTSRLLEKYNPVRIINWGKGIKNLPPLQTIRWTIHTYLVLWQVFGSLANVGPARTHPGTRQFSP